MFTSKLQIWLQFSALTLIALLSPVASQALDLKTDSRPNVLVILSDDQSYADLSIYGSGHIQTPNLDELATEGVRFTQFYATMPFCTPSRASLLTGLTPQRAGVISNTYVGQSGDRGLQRDRVTIAEVLKENGYRTAHVGKWHLSDKVENLPNHQGFDYSYGHHGGYIDNYSHGRYPSGRYHHDLYRNGEEIFETGTYFPDLMVREALQFIEEGKQADAKATEPFFMYFAINLPHYPYQPDEKWLRKYRADGLEYPYSDYAAFVSSMDERIGMLVDGLKTMGLLDDTIIIFQTDHGHSTEGAAGNGGGSAGIYRGVKFSMLEGGLRVPAIIRWPGVIPANQTRDQFAVGTDWFPTILDYLGIAWNPADIDGASLRRQIADPSARTNHKSWVWNWDRTIRNGLNHWAVREGDWKLLINPHDTSKTALAIEGENTYRGGYLVNLEDDPGEANNLYDEHPEIVERLMNLKEQFEKKWISKK